MPIARMNEGAPRVDLQSNGEIGLYAVDDAATDSDDRYIGFLFDRTTAYATALRLLATLGDDASVTPMLQIKDIEGGVVSDPEHGTFARLVLHVEGAALPFYLDRPELARFTAGLANLVADLEAKDL